MAFIKKLYPTPHTTYSKGGFTLIEMIVAVAIIGIIAGAFFINLRKGEQNLALQRSAQILTQAIDDTRNSALSNRLHNGTVSAGGYGARFIMNTNSILIFADCNQNARFDEVGTGAASCLNASSGGVNYPENNRVIALERGVIINSVSPCDGACVFDLVFSSPNARASLRPAPTNGAASITLRVGNDQMSILINALGVSQIQ